MPVIVQNGSSNTIVVDRARTAAIVENRPSAVQATDNASTVAIGTPGVQGTPGPSGSDALIQTASEALGGHRVVRSTGGGSVGYADSHNAAHGDDTVGMTLNAAALGEQVSIVTAGPISFNGWTWTADEPVFLAANGLLTQTAPSEVNGDVFCQVIGHAQDATTVFVRIESPTYL